MKFIAHPGPNGRPDQSLEEHLLGVSRLAGGASAKLGLEKAGLLLGLLHDIGKYSKEFQSYIKSALGILNPDQDDFVDAEQLKGKIDHSTSGAQLVWQALSENSQALRGSQVVGQVLALCIASHHSGLIDCIDPKADSSVPAKFKHRMEKADERTHLLEVRGAMDSDIANKIETLLSDETLVREVVGHFTEIFEQERVREGGRPSETIALIQLGLAVRFLFSCLIDADRTDTANFESARAAALRSYGNYRDWDTLIQRLESALNRMDSTSPVGQARASVSEACKVRADGAQGIFTLTVPTGGGKTLASLRFALHHARKHTLDRIIFIIPFTSIIEQNAKVVRSVLEQEGVDQYGSIVLENHSNLEPDQQTWRSKLLSENWDAPIVFTTNVQFLEALFGGGTRAVRRLHQLTRAVLIFDEVQTIPVRCVHLFCNCLNYLAGSGRSSVVLCTATQPLLGELQNRELGALTLGPQNELISDVEGLFHQLKRVEIVDITRPEGWTVAAIAEFANAQATESGSCLVVVNTKRAAKELYQAVQAYAGLVAFHLSTSMCPKHRADVLTTVRSALGNTRLVCVSTQLIEAGVDIDFGTVIRFVAGFDSIAQAAGRCNRHGLQTIGRTFIVNPREESLSALEDIRLGRESAFRVLGEFRDNPQTFNSDLLSPELMRKYFRYYFFDRAEKMTYPVSAEAVGRDDTLINLLAKNEGSYPTGLFQGALRQAFMTAGKIFQTIDAPTRGIVVPYGDEGREIIAGLGSAFELKKQFALLRRAQRFSVNVFPHVLKKLEDGAALKEVQPESGILFADERFYSSEFGLTVDESTGLSTQIF